MTKPVALADATYERLKRRKRRGESFSDTIDRLIGDQAKDPLRFLEDVPRSRRSASQRLADIEAEREASWEGA